ncbi:F-box only protein 47 isoform X2 [Lissotriton helveticus]
MPSSTSNSFTVIPNQKYRRSTRRSNQLLSNANVDFQHLTALGFFQTLPLEIFHMVLEYLSVKEISTITMVSKTFSSHLIDYISTPSGNKRLLLQDFHSQENPSARQNTYVLQHYKSLGLLFKRCTLLLPTKERLKYIHKILSEISCFKLSGCAAPSQCFGLSCYGAFLQTVTAGWDELECHRVYNFICELSYFPRKVQAVVSSKPGHVAWQKMTEGPADEACLKGLADAIKLLYDMDAREWTPDDVISLVDELSVIPREWLLENNARLLILSGNSICFTFMASKAVNGRSVELARLVVFLALVCEKDLYCMDWAVKMMQKVCKVFSTSTERNAFLQNVENTFARVVMDMLHSVISVRYLQCIGPSCYPPPLPSIMCNFVTWNVRGLGNPVKRQKQVQSALPEASADSGHSIQPGDWVCLKNFQRKKNQEPRWGPPRQVLLVTRKAVKVVRKKNWIHGVHCKRVPLPLLFDQWVRKGVGDSEGERVPRLVPFSSAHLDRTRSEKEDDDVLQEAVPSHLRLNTTNLETLFREQTVPDKTRYNLRPRLIKNN